MTVLDRFSLAGRVAVVTGASSGLGVVLARALAEAGADVALGARRTAELQRTGELVRAAGRRAAVIGVDVTVGEDCRRLVAATVAQLGRVDILVNNAGTGTVVPALAESPEDFDRVVDVNLGGCHRMALACAEVMSPGSSIVNISSVLAVTSAQIPQAAYAASKAGLLGLTVNLAHQWTGRRGIRVNAVAPGFFATELTAPHLDGAAPLLTRIPVGRLGDPDELAAAVVFLAGDGASYVTGQTLFVDGGFTTG